MSHSYLLPRLLTSTVKIAIASLFLVASVFVQVSQANTPCSGRKGGIDHCQGETFICRDGSVSASKKSCEATMGATGLLSSDAEDMQPTLSGECSCRGANYCTGPRGGRYCLTDSGKKSYLRK
ncbi:hypothetical protein [Rhizobium etli]|uniref:YdcA family protein n=1 Tax=Rhizobium etli TaxID=29449 RepID=UPI001FD926EB|nr:hypothetical protein [Rhizobium etli]